jgi:CBS domain-containing protein
MPFSQLPPVSKARDIMTTKLVTLNPEMDVFHGIEVLVRHNISGAPVIDADRRLLGIFSEKSCMKVLIDAAYEGLPTNQIGKFMDETPTTITPETQLLSIAQIFLTTPRRRLPVIEDEKLVGQVSRRDVIRAASKIMKLTKDHKKILLYLSALLDMQDAPAV